MNLQERIEALEAEFNERLKALKAEVQQEQEFPQDGDEYWYIDDEGGVWSTVYDNHYIDRYRQSIGNIFRTKEEAEFAVEKLKVEAELRKFSRPFKRDSLNVVMCFDTETDELYSETKRFMTQGAFYFEGLVQIQEAIKTIGEDRIKKYIFGVED